MFLLPLCVCVSVYVCVRDLLLFPNLAGPCHCLKSLYTPSLLENPPIQMHTQPPGRRGHHVPSCLPHSWCPQLTQENVNQWALPMPAQPGLHSDGTQATDRPACLPPSALGGHKTGRHEIKLQLQAPVWPLVSFWDPRLPDLSLLLGAFPGWGQGHLFSGPVCLCHLDEKA